MPEAPREFLVEVHVLVEAASHGSAERQVAEALHHLAKRIPGFTNAYVADVRHEDDDESEPIDD